jgi:hypothetical protein
MKYLNDIVNYFQYQCEEHPLLLHADVSGQRVFEVRPLEEAFADFRTGATEKGYFVRLVVPTFGMNGSVSKAVKQYQIGLLVGKWYSRREDEGRAAIVAASSSEEVFDQIISKIISDSQNGHPLWEGYADSLNDLNIQGDYYFHGGDGSYAGVFATMDLRTPRKMAIECQTITWADGGLTPV